MVPGRALHRLAKFLLPPDVCDQIIAAQLADFQHEWERSASAKQRATALVQGYLAFWSALPLCATSGLRKDARQLLIRVSISAAIFVFGFRLVGPPDGSFTNALPWVLAAWALLGDSRTISISPLLVALSCAVVIRLTGLGDQSLPLVPWVLSQLTMFCIGLLVVPFIRRSHRRAP
jgi:hypothetical protein